MSLKFKTVYGTEVGTTVYLDPKLANFRGDWDERTYAKEGLELKTVSYRAQGAMDEKGETNEKNTMIIEEEKVPLRRRAFWAINERSIKGNHFSKFRKAVLEVFPYFKSWDITRVVVENKEHGNILQLVPKRDRNSNELYMIVNTLDGEPVNEKHMRKLYNLMGDLAIGPCARKPCMHTSEILCKLPKNLE